MDRCVCALVIVRRGETTHSRVDVNNTHLSMINPLNTEVWTPLLHRKSNSLQLYRLNGVQCSITILFSPLLLDDNLSQDINIVISM